MSSKTKEWQFDGVAVVDVDCHSDISFVPAAATARNLVVRVTGAPDAVSAFKVERLEDGVVKIDEAVAKNANRVGSVTASGDVFVNYGNAAHVGPVRGSITVTNMRGGAVAVSGGGQVVVNRGAIGRIVVNSVDVTDTVAAAQAQAEPSKIEVLVPQGAQLELHLTLRGVCKCNVGRIGSPRVLVCAQDLSRFEADLLGTSKVRAWDGSTVAIGTVVGDLDVGIEDAACLTTSGGQIGSLRVRAEDAARAIIGGIVDDADMRAEDASLVTVARAKVVSRKRVGDAAKIHVTRVG